MPLAEHFFVSSCDGALHDTRVPDWHKRPLRPDYQRTFAKIDNGRQLRATLRAGAYAWPGGYPMFFLTSDGESLSFDAVRQEFRQCAYALRHRLNDGWRIVACAINYEDAGMVCAHTGQPIQSAHGECTQ